MTLIKREKTDKPIPLATIDDLGWIAALPLAALGALVIPERSWPGLALLVMRIKTALVTTRHDREALENLAMAGLATRDNLVQQKAVAIERVLHVMRELMVGWNPPTELVGAEHLERARQSGRGAVLWIARCAYTSLIEKMVFAKHGYAVHHVSRSQHGFSGSRFGIRFLNPLRTIPEYRYAAGRIMIDPANPAASMIEARKLLKSNAFVSILSSVSEGQLLVRVKLGDRGFQFSGGPPRLAKLAGAPLLPVFIHRDPKDGVYRVTIEEPIDLSDDGGKGDMIERAVQEFAERHRRFLGRYPLQWRDWRRMTAAPSTSAGT